MANKRETVYIPELVKSRQKAARLPIAAISTPPKEPLVTVHSGSPWKYYEEKYALKFWCVFTVVTPCHRPRVRKDESCTKSAEVRMIRKISGEKADKHISNLCQVFHANVVENHELYDRTVMKNPIAGSYDLVCEYMPTSLQHLCRAPEYPSEPQLGSILHQVLCAVEFLSGTPTFLVHEQMSCASLLINFEGDVKVSDIERCKQHGDESKFFSSFHAVTGALMDKSHSGEKAIFELARSAKWSSQANDMFKRTKAPGSLYDLLHHGFLDQRSKEELRWLVPLVLISARHERTQCPY